MSNPEAREKKFVTVARVLRARGNKGEVAAELLTDFPERLQQQNEFFLSSDSAAPRRVTLQAFWVDRNHPGQCVLHFAGITSIDEAERLRGLEVQITWEQRVVLPQGSYFVTDLIGCAVFELAAKPNPVASSPCALEEAPELLGRVRDVYLPGENQRGTPLLAVDTSHGELLIPLAEDICKRIDVSARRIEVAFPEGLRDLNT